MQQRVSVEMRDSVADVRLARPDKLNALDDAMFEALRAAGKRLKAEQTLRAVVLSGEGRGFCAGLGPDEVHMSRPGKQKIAEYVAAGSRLGGRVPLPPDPPSSV